MNACFSMSKASSCKLVTVVLESIIKPPPPSLPIWNNDFGIGKRVCPIVIPLRDGRIGFLINGVLLTAPFETFKSSREPNKRLLLLLSPIEVKQYENSLESSCETKDRVPRPSPTIPATLFIPMTWLFTPYPKPILVSQVQFFF